MEAVVTTRAVSRAKLRSNCHHQQTDTQLFTGQMPFTSPNQQRQRAEGKAGLSDLLTIISPSVACSGQEDGICPEKEFCSNNPRGNNFAGLSMIWNGFQKNGSKFLK